MPLCYETLRRKLYEYDPRRELLSNSGRPIEFKERLTSALDLGQSPNADDRTQNKTLRFSAIWLPFGLFNGQNNLNMVLKVGFRLGPQLFRSGNRDTLQFFCRYTRTQFVVCS